MKNIDIVNIPLAEAEFSVLDFETTGTSPHTARAIEIGIVKIKNMKITGSYRSFLNPETNVPYFITQLTGITTGDVIDAPLFCDVVGEINDFLSGSILVAHNLPFDLSFLKREFQIAGRDYEEQPQLCTLRLARKIFPDLKSKSLESVRKHLRLKHKDVHRALGDATVTAKILLKMIERIKEDNDIETASDLINFQSVPRSAGYRLVKKKLANDLISVPSGPGVYFFKDSLDKIFYIGKAKSLKKRVNNYFANTASAKAKKIVKASSRLGFKETNSELTALLAEAELIKIHFPKFNQQLKKYGQTYFIKLDIENNFPLPKSTSKFDLDGNDFFGPYARRETAAAIVEVVNKTFHLRECTDKQFKKKNRCYLADIDRCLAPCTENVTPEYTNELNNVYEFLGGQNQNAVNRLLEQMKKQSERMLYEEAAETRDTVQKILNQLNRSAILIEPVNKANVLIEVTSSGKKDYLLMLQGKVFIKNDPVAEKDYFDEALEDYFAGTVSLFEELDDRDLERTKIALAWLARNREKIRIFNLSEFESSDELYFKM